MFQIVFFTTASGRSPIKDFIKKQPTQTREKIASTITYLQKYGFHLDTDFLRRMSGTRKLWELRIKYTSKQYRFLIARITDDTIAILHGFIKKTMKTPRKEIETAEKRFQQLQQALEVYD